LIPRLAGRRVRGKRGGRERKRRKEHGPLSSPESEGSGVRERERRDGDGQDLIKICNHEQLYKEKAQPCSFSIL